MSKILKLRQPPRRDGSLVRLAQAELAWFEIARSEMLAVDVHDREILARLIGAVLPHLGPLDRIANDLGVSTTTIARWATGATLPPIYARPVVTSYFADVAAERIRGLQARIDAAA